MAFCGNMFTQCAGSMATGSSTSLQREMTETVVMVLMMAFLLPAVLVWLMAGVGCVEVSALCVVQCRVHLEVCVWCWYIGATGVWMVWYMELDGFPVPVRSCVGRDANMRFTIVCQCASVPVCVSVCEHASPSRYPQ